MLRKLFPIFIILAGCAVEPAQKRTRLVNADLGIDVRYDTTPMDVTDLEQIMQEFLSGYIQRNPTALNESLTEDFIWTVHTGSNAYHGTKYIGVDGMLGLLRERDKYWKQTKYSNIAVYGAGDSIFQTFRVRGMDTRSGPFDAKGVDIYKIRNGRISAKDSYWKHNNITVTVQ